MYLYSSVSIDRLEEKTKKKILLFYSYLYVWSELWNVYADRNITLFFMHWPIYLLKSSSIGDGVDFIKGTL